MLSYGHHRAVAGREDKVAKKLDQAIQFITDQGFDPKKLPDSKTD